MILKKSSVKLTNNDKLLLINGLNFASTPNWSETTKNVEWKNLHKHIRRLDEFIQIGHIFLKMKAA